MYKSALFLLLLLVILGSCQTTQPPTNIPAKQPEEGRNPEGKASDENSAWYGFALIALAATGVLNYGKLVVENCLDTTGVQVDNKEWLAEMQKIIDAEG